MNTRDNDPRLTRAVVPLYLNDENGEEQEFLSRPLSDKDMDEIDAWLRREFVKRVEDAISPSSSKVMVQAAAGQIVATVPTISFMDGAIGSRMASSTVGLSRIVWQSLRAEHPNLAFHRIKALLMNESNRKASQKHWRDTNVGGGSSTEGKPKDEDQHEPKSTED